MSGSLRNGTGLLTRFSARRMLLRMPSSKYIHFQTMPTTTIEVMTGI
jgi:hypothetical protein